MISMDTSTLDGMSRILQTVAPEIQAMLGKENIDPSVYPLLSDFYEGRTDTGGGGDGWSTEMDQFGTAGSGNAMQNTKPMQDPSLAWSVGTPQNPPSVAAVVRYDYSSNGPTPMAFSSYGKSPMYQFDWIEQAIALDLQCDMVFYTYHDNQSPNFVSVMSAQDDPAATLTVPPTDASQMAQYDPAFVPYSADLYPYGYDALQGFRYSVRNLGAVYWKSGTPYSSPLQGPASCPPSNGGAGTLHSWSSNHMKVGICQAFNDSLTEPVPGQRPLNVTGTLQPYVIVGGWNRAGTQWKRGSIFTAFASQPVWESLWCMFSFDGPKQWNASYKPTD